jgi:hypothetical protein
MTASSPHKASKHILSLTPETGLHAQYLLTRAMLSGGFADYCTSCGPAPNNRASLVAAYASQATNVSRVLPRDFEPHHKTCRYRERARCGGQQDARQGAECDYCVEDKLHQCPVCLKLRLSSLSSHHPLYSSSQLGSTCYNYHPP